MLMYTLIKHILTHIFALLIICTLMHILTFMYTDTVTDVYNNVPWLFQWSEFGGQFFGQQPQCSAN